MCYGLLVVGWLWIDGDVCVSVCVVCGVGVVDVGEFIVAHSRLHSPLGSP